MGIYPMPSLLNAVHHDHHQAVFTLEQCLNGDIALCQYAFISIQLFSPISSIVLYVTGFAKTILLGTQFVAKNFDFKG